MEKVLHNKLRDKYLDLKKDLRHICHEKARKYLTDRTDVMRRKLTQGDYDSVDSVKDELADLQRTYDGPKFNGYELLLQEAVSEMLAKCCDHFTHNIDKEHTRELRHAQQQV